MQATKPILAATVQAGDTGLTIVLPDRRVHVAWERCSARLGGATPQQRLQLKLSPGGYGVHWPLIDEDLSIAGLVAAANEIE